MNTLEIKVHSLKETLILDYLMLAVFKLFKIKFVMPFDLSWMHLL